MRLAKEQKESKERFQAKKKKEQDLEKKRELLFGREEGFKPATVVKDNAKSKTRLRVDFNGETAYLPMDEFEKFTKMSDEEKEKHWPKKAFAAIKAVGAGESKDETD